MYKKITSFFISCIFLVLSFSNLYSIEDKSMKEAMDLGRDGKYEQAIQKITDIINSNTQNIDGGTYGFLGIMYYKSKQYDNALNSFSKSIELDPNFPMPYYFLGQTYEKKAVNESDKNIKKDLYKKSLDAWKTFIELTKKPPKEKPKTCQSPHKCVKLDMKKKIKKAQKHIANLEEKINE
jgi:tetratricopeptide (TPR) repeat protein